MKALLFLFLTGFVFADLPRLTVEHGEERQNLRLDEVEVTVRVEGNLVETRMSVNFFNETNRNQEGEFRLPLPEGASVNHYALEVNGKMREATVVEKEQARNAYETIKARGVDPGIVEKMAGNIYRTRIFPVLSQKAKRVSIGYVQPLEKVSGEMIYKLPFGVAEKIGKFSLKIEGDLSGFAVEMTGGGALEKEGESYSFKSTDAAVMGNLILKKKAPKGFSGEVQMIDDETYAYIFGEVPPELSKVALRKPKSLTVIWDASASGYERNLKVEIAFLGRLVEELGEVQVRLFALGAKSVDLGEFEVKDGDWTTLRQAVEGIFYDGAADWRDVVFETLGGEEILIFGGDYSVFPIEQEWTNGNLSVVHSARQKVSPFFAEMARVNGGGVIDLRKLDAEKAVDEFLRPKFVVGLVGEKDSYSWEIRDGQVRIFAKWTWGASGRMDVVFMDGIIAKTSIPVTMDVNYGGDALIFLWAERQLKELVLARSLIGDREKEAIIAHCKKFGLVSDFTSLIVLELMADHINFRIPPPEPELQAEYQAGLRSHKRLESKRLASAWAKRVKWYETDFPWVESMLFPRYLRVKKWTNAQLAVFEKEQLAQTKVMEFFDWKNEAEKVFKEKNDVQDLKTYKKWKGQLDVLQKSGDKLGAQDAELPKKGEFGVSVRGLVSEPQTLNVKPGATLKDVLKKVGGLHSEGSAGRVAIYRSGKRKIYNLLNQNYREVKLLPGDMVVAMGPESYGGMDPFASQEEDIANSNPAVLEEDVPMDVEMRRPVIGENEPFGSGERLPDMPGKVVEVKIGGDRDERLDELLKSKNLWEDYQKWRVGAGDDLESFTRIAEEFYRREDWKKGRIVLTNFYSGRGFHVPSLRAAAYWMIQFGDYTGAEKVLENIAKEFPDDPLMPLDTMRIRYLFEGGFRLFEQVFMDDERKKIEEFENTFFAEMMLMDRDEIADIGYEMPVFSSEPQIFPSDLRIVVFSSVSEDRTQMTVTEPNGNATDGYGVTMVGGKLSRTNGLAEFIVRKAMPGDYQIELGNQARGTYQIAVFTNWGRKGQVMRLFTMNCDGSGGLIKANSVKFEF